MPGETEPDFALVSIKVAPVDDDGLGAVLGLESREGHGLTSLSVTEIILVDADNVLIVIEKAIVKEKR